MIVAGLDLRIPDRRLIAAKLSLDGLAEVLQQMKAIGDLLRLRRALTWTAVTAPLSDRALACSFRLARIVVSLTGMPSRLISRSEGRPPALWPSSRTIPARRAVRLSNGAAGTVSLTSRE